MAALVIPVASTAIYKNKNLLVYTKKKINIIFSGQYLYLRIYTPFKSY